MDILMSNRAPGKLTSKSQLAIWKEYLSLASSIKIATGYITSDAIIELKKIIEVNKKPHLDLFIGMHYFESFTKSQYDAVQTLDEFLKEKSLGNIYLSKIFRFHGKMYSFVKDGCSIGAVVGSSNLGSFIGTSDDLYEADCFFEYKKDEAHSTRIDALIYDIINKLGTPFSECSITTFNTESTLLEGHYGVNKIKHEDLLRISNKRKSVFFDLPLKPEPKSNLNSFFGKGRTNKRGFEMPRPWYEVEIIVSKEITMRTGYPQKQNFEVYTQDGWNFKCGTNGDYGKNFRSIDDLKILGKWIKGSMEQNNVLTIGQLVTEDVLNAFGKKALRLTPTDDLDKWLLEMV